MARQYMDHGQGIGRSAERQMRQWALSFQVDEQRRRESADMSQRTVHPYIAISREAGALGSLIAARIGQRLGWQVLDRELLDYMVRHYSLASEMLELVDETTSNWLIEILGKWLSRQIVTQAEYVTHVGRIVLLAAHHASTVFVGRGAQFLLPRDQGLTVRVVAPREIRIQRIMNERSLDRQQAAADMDGRDRGRRDFLKKYYRHDVDDPHLYDLVINTERLDENDSVELVLHQFHKQFP